MSHVDPAAAPAAASIRTETVDPWIGRVIAGEFELVERLGAGVQGTVYRALQRPFDRPVALKLLTGPNAGNAQYRLRFLREARALELLHHPSIVRLLRYGTIREDGVQPGGLYIAEELVEGTALEALIDADGPLAPSRALRIADQVLDALAVAHRHGVAHRDIKPAHIMLHHDLRGEAQVTLIDFGLTRRENGFDDDDEDLTQAGWLLGSPLYMAPEPLAEIRMGPAADQYSLGVVLYEMLTGQPPFSGTLESVLLGHAVEPVPALPDGLDPTGGLGEIIRRALAKDPESRYPTPGAMRAAIERVRVMMDEDGDTRVEPPCPALMALIAERRAEHAAHRTARSRSTLPQAGQRVRWLLTASAVGASLVVASAAAAASLLF